MVKMNLRLTVLIVLVAASVRVARADGGMVQLRSDTGPFAITLFTSPSPARTGPVDFSVLVQNVSSLDSVLDADVSIRLSTDSEPEILVHPTRAQAQNKLLYAALVTLPRPGPWRATVTVRRRDIQISVSGQMEVSPAGSGVTSYWGYIALAPLAIGVLAIREWLVRRQVQPRHGRRRSGSAPLTAG